MLQGEGGILDQPARILIFILILILIEKQVTRARTPEKNACAPGPPHT
jgi:hypothetical protein